VAIRKVRVKVLEPNTGQFAHMEMDGVKKSPKNTSRRCRDSNLVSHESYAAR
jgi:hypothetical protein